MVGNASSARSWKNVRLGFCRASAWVVLLLAKRGVRALAREFVAGVRPGPASDRAAHYFHVPPGLTHLPRLRALFFLCPQ